MIVAGCPANGRGWIIKDWVAHLAAAAEFADQNMTLMVVSPPDDHEMNDKLEEAADSFGLYLVRIDAEEPPRVDQRNWNHDRYHKMVELRNQLLYNVRLLRPQYFLSIDSDILIQSTCLKKMVDTVEDLDYSAVASKVWLSPTAGNIVNYAIKGPQGVLRRQDADNTFRVDVLMALKLMDSDAYKVDYSWDQRGEDIGWSDNAREKGLMLGFIGSPASKHVMHKDKLDEIDIRLGW